MSKTSTFEADIKRLDEIVRLLERSDMPLEEIIKLFEEGVALSKRCRKTLDSAEQKVELLLTHENEPQTKEFKQI